MQITVTYRRTSRLSLRVTPTGKVNVSAPFHTPETTIRQFIADHRQWIEDSLRKMEGLHRQRTSFYDQLPLRTPRQQAEAAAPRGPLCSADGRGAPTHRLQAVHLEVGRLRS